MNKEQLKKLLKPLLKECLKEIVFEEGFLSPLIKEVMTAIGGQNLLYEHKTPKATKELPNNFSQKISQSRQELREIGFKERKEMEQRLSKITGMGNVFENVSPIEEARNPGNLSSRSSMEKSGTALKDLSPDDPGVKLDGILNLIGGDARRWTRQLNKNNTEEE